MQTISMPHLPTELDFLIQDALIVDGTGLAPRLGHVGVCGDRIVSVTTEKPCVPVKQVVNAAGLVLCPGFIDAHTHDDRALISSPTMEPKISQGITTVVVGNCGVSLAPLVLGTDDPPQPLDALGDADWYRFDTFGKYRRAVESNAPAVNVYALVGHTTLRRATMSDLSKAATASQIRSMERMLEQSLQEGARGFSSGLFYPPASAAPAKEVNVLAKIAARHKGIYTAHIRDEAADVMMAIQEAVEIAQEAGIPLVLSHHKVAGIKNHGKTLDTLPYVTRCATHHAIGMDVYPYDASSTMLNIKSVNAAKRTIITWSTSMPEVAGKDLTDVARGLGISVEAAIEKLSPAGAIFFMMDEEDVKRVLKFPMSMIGSDGLPHDPNPHPRLWGSFTRVLGHYVRDTGLLTLEDAVRKMTSLTASQFKMTDRGVISPGAFADLVLLDSSVIAAGNSWSNSKAPSLGISQVWVNGKSSWVNGAPTGNRAGSWL